MQIDKKKIETADETLIAVLKDIDKFLQRSEWDYKRTKFDLKDDKTLKIIRDGFTMFDLQGIDEIARNHRALWFVGNAFPSPIDITLTVYMPK